MLRYGDYIIFVSIAVNLLALCAYAYEGHWKNALYWFAALQLNLSLVMMR